MGKKIAAAIAAYAVVASLTGGYVFNHRGIDGGRAIVVAYGWPFYWLGRFGIEVTK